MRGVGQTRNLIYNLPNERCMLVTPTHSICKHIEKSLIDLRGKDFAKKIKIINVSLSEDLNKMIGYNHLIFFDHSFFDLVEEEIAKKALNYAEGAAIVYHHHKGNFK